MGSWCSKEKIFQGRIQEFLIGEWGVGVQILVQKGLLSFFTANHFFPPPHTPSHQLRLYVIIPWPLTVYLNCTRNASVNSSCVQCPPPPGLLRGIYLPCQSRGWGICKFCTARGPGICQPPGHSRAFDTHAVSYQNITTQKVLLEKKQIGSSVKDRNKL